MKKKKWVVAALAICLVAIAAFIALFVTVHVFSLRKYPEVKSDVIIVLGARVMPDGELSTTLEYRVKNAYEAYEKGLAGAFIVTGAQGPDEPVTEAVAMAEYLKNRGVSEDSIFIEDKSTDTLANLSNAKAIMGEHGFKTALLVTSDYHVPRALWLAERVGIDATGYSAPGPDLWYNRVIARVKESLSWVKFFLLYKL